MKQLHYGKTDQVFFRSWHDYRYIGIKIIFFISYVNGIIDKSSQEITFTNLQKLYWMLLPYLSKPK